MTMFQDVLEFHKKFGCTTNPKPCWPSEEEQKLRWDLITEELDELNCAWIDGDRDGFADALVDLVYVILGTGAAYGMDLDAVWAEVHAANMKKTAQNKRSDGKITKPEGWTPPNVKEVLDSQRAII